MWAFVNCELNDAELQSASYDVFPDVTKPLHEPPEIFNWQQLRETEKETNTLQLGGFHCSEFNKLVAPLWLCGQTTTIIK